MLFWLFTNLCCSIWFICLQWVIENSMGRCTEIEQEWVVPLGSNPQWRGRCGSEATTKLRPLRVFGYYGSRPRCTRYGLLSSELYAYSSHRTVLRTELLFLRNCSSRPDYCVSPADQRYSTCDYKDTNWTKPSYRGLRQLQTSITPWVNYTMIILKQGVLNLCLLRFILQTTWLIW